MVQRINLLSVVLRKWSVRAKGFYFLHRSVLVVFPELCLHFSVALKFFKSRLRFLLEKIEAFVLLQILTKLDTI